MNNYEPETPRAAFGLAAVAMSILTIGALVAAPAAFDSRNDEAVLLATAKARATPALEVAIIPARIEVIGTRDTNVAWAMAPDGKPNCKPET